MAIRNMWFILANCPEPREFMLTNAREPASMHMILVRVRARAGVVFVPNA